ncbi:MAG TPA: putative Ig domain-containing protein [Rariglobus sp.]|nr:putative Ig domain-containing protein [Rariglobus sp.]
MKLPLLCRLTVLLLVPAAPAVRAAEPIKVPWPGAEILTPPAPATPRINGPAIYGVHPGSPFLYHMPVTGDRPMEFAVAGLPAGLSVNSKTGDITGSSPKAGEYMVTLWAKNAKGKASKKFKIVSGETLALTPPLGWNSYNCWEDSIDQAKTLAAAKAMVASGLDQHGWSYINIDDAWQGLRGGKYNAIQPNEKFPDMKGLCDEIHAMGLKVGIYSTPWITSYAGLIGGSADNPEGSWVRGPVRVAVRRIGKYSFAAVDAKQWAEWGFDYMKYDWRPNKAPETKEMADAMRASGRDMILSLSNSAPFEGAAEYTPYANCWRVTGDIVDNWTSMSRIAFGQDQWAPYAKPGHWNDADMLVVGQVGWGKPLHPSHLNPNEQYTHISMWCLLSSPLILGCDLARLDPFTFSLLTNDEVLAVDQDELGRQATRVSADKDAPDVYIKPLADGTWAVGLFNRKPDPASVKVSWSDLKLSGSQPVRDLWRQKDLGTFADGFSATVQSHGVVLIRVGKPARSP